jgi:hypothetical protein
VPLFSGLADPPDAFSFVGGCSVPVKNTDAQMIPGFGLALFCGQAEYFRHIRADSGGIGIYFITSVDNYDKRIYPLFLQSLAYSKIYAVSIVYL